MDPDDKTPLAIKNTGAEIISYGAPAVSYTHLKSELSNCFTISDKARCIAGSVLEVVCAFGSNI